MGVFAFGKDSTRDGGTVSPGLGQKAPHIFSAKCQAVWGETHSAANGKGTCGFFGRGDPGAALYLPQPSAPLQALSGAAVRDTGGQALCGNGEPAGYPEKAGPEGGKAAETADGDGDGTEAQKAAAKKAGKKSATSTAAQAKKLRAQLEGLDKVETLVLGIMDVGLGRLSGPRYQRLQRAFTVWLYRVVLQRTGMTAAENEVNDLQEVRAMLAERALQWKDEYIRQGVLMGREEGLEQGLTFGLRTLLESRLGSLPPQVEASLAGIGDTRRLCTLTLAASRVASYKEFLEEIRRAADA